MVAIYELFNPLGVCLLRFSHAETVQVVSAGTDWLRSGGLNALFQPAAMEIFDKVDWVDVAGIPVGVQDIFDYAQKENILSLLSNSVNPPLNN